MLCISGYFFKERQNTKKKLKYKKRERKKTHELKKKKINDIKI